MQIGRPTPTLFEAVMSACGDLGDRSAGGRIGGRFSKVMRNMMVVCWWGDLHRHMPICKASETEQHLVLEHSEIRIIWHVLIAECISLMVSCSRNLLEKKLQYQLLIRLQAATPCRVRTKVALRLAAFLGRTGVKHSPGPVSNTSSHS